MELQFLRANLTKATLEHWATRPEARNKLAKALFKLSNQLFPSLAGRGDKRPAVQMKTATTVLRAQKVAGTGHVISGGGANGTGKSR